MFDGVLGRFSRRTDGVKLVAWVVVAAGLALAVLWWHTRSFLAAGVASGVSALVAIAISRIPSRAGRAKTVLVVWAPSAFALAVIGRQEGSLQAAGIASGVSAGIAVTAALYVFHPRLNYWLLPLATRRRHNDYVLWLAANIVRASSGLAGSSGTAGARTDALRTIHVVSNSLPYFTPSRIDMDIDISEEEREVIAGFQRVAEEVLGPVERPLEHSRLIYQINLNTALGHLLSGVGYELGGHGYVTDLWGAEPDGLGDMRAKAARGL